MEFTPDPESFLTPLKDKEGRHYAQKPNGHIDFGDVSRNLMGQQGQHGSRYIDGAIEDYPALGHGLRFNGLGESSHHSIGIHPDDIEEFLLRFHAWRAYQSGFVKGPNDEDIELCDGDREYLGQYLKELGAFIPLESAP